MIRPEHKPAYAWCGVMLFSLCVWAVIIWAVLKVIR